MKIEAPDSGGTEFDEFPTALDPSEDFVETRGIAIQNDTSSDEEVLLSRNSNSDMTFEDAHNSPVTLTTLLAGGFDISRIILTVAGTMVYIDDGDIVLKPE